MNDDSGQPGPIGPGSPSTAAAMVAGNGTANLDIFALKAAGAFLRAAAVVLDEATDTRVAGHLDLGPDHHTPWGIVHGGVYATAVESAASIGASLAVRDRGQIAVGLTNTTHFLRSLTAGRVHVHATALHQGRSQQLWKVDINDEQGRLMAHGEVRLQNITPQPLPGQ